MSIEDSWLEVPAQTVVSNDSFGRGVQDYVFGVSQPNVWFPSESYFVVDLTVTGPAGAAPAVKDQIALAENAVANAYTNAYFRAGGQTVSSLVNYAAQSAQVAARAGHSWAWQQSVGEAHKLVGSLSDRIADLSLSSAGRSQVGVGGGASDDRKEEFYKPCRGTARATLTLGPAPSAATPLPAVAPAAMADPGVSGATDPPTRAEVVTTITNVTNNVNAAINTVSAQLQARDTALAAGIQRTIVSGDADDATGDLATNFRDGTADAGVQIHLGGSTYTIVSVATDASAAATQTITVVGPGGPAVAATSDWYATRRNLTASGQARNTLQVIWRPALGIFEHKGACGSGQYRFSLSPDPNYRLTMIETLLPGFDVLGANQQFDVRINDVNFYAKLGKMRIDDGISQLDLPEWQAQSKVMLNNSGQYQFTVPQSTTILYVFWQSPKAGLDPAFPPSKFRAAANSEQNLDLLQVTYGGVTRPMVRWNSAFDGSQNKLFQYYKAFVAETGRQDASGGVESFGDWIDRGPIFAFCFPRDENARDTEVRVQVNFGNPEGGVFDTQTRLFVVAEYRRLTSITHANGQITQVSALNA